MGERKSKRKWLETRTGREAVAFYLFISPWVVGFVVLGVGVLLAGLAITFTNYDGLMALDRLRFWGLRNYARVLEDDKLPLVFTNTIMYAAVAVPLGLVVQLGVALLMNQNIKGRSLYRTLYYIPSVLPIVAAVIAWKIMFDKNTGLVNAFLSLMQPGTAIHWLSRGFVRAVLIIISLWIGTGGGMVIFLAGLQGIPRELKEAAMIDGASNWRVFRHVTAPLLSPVVFFQLTLGMIQAMQVLMEPVLLTRPVGGYGGLGGGLHTEPTRSIYMWSNYAMVQIFGNQQRYGYGTVLLWMLFLMVALLSAVVFKSARYWVHYEVEQ